MRERVLFLDLECHKAKLGLVDKVEVCYVDNPKSEVQRGYYPLGAAYRDHPFDPEVSQSPLRLEEAYPTCLVVINQRGFVETSGREPEPEEFEHIDEVYGNNTVVIAVQEAFIETENRALIEGLPNERIKTVKFTHYSVGPCKSFSVDVGNQRTSTSVCPISFFRERVEEPRQGQLFKP